MTFFASDKDGLLKELMSCQGDTFDNCVTKYARSAEYYDDVFGPERFLAPCAIAAGVAKHAPRSLPVLDFGCGTGGASLALRKETQHLEQPPHIVGYDVTQSMMDVAVTKNACDTYLLDPTGSRSGLNSMLTGRLGAVMASGVLTGAAHVPVDAIDDLVEALVPGGVLVFNWRPQFKAGDDENQTQIIPPNTEEEELTSKLYVDRCRKLVAEGRLALVSDDAFTAFISDVGDDSANKQTLYIWKRL